MNVTVSQYLKTFLKRLVEILEAVIFVYCIMKFINIWNIYITLVSQYFPNDQCMILQNPAQVKLQDKPMDTIVTEYKIFIDMISDSRLYLSLVRF